MATTAAQTKVSTYRISTINGRAVRTATVVTFADGIEVKFMERLPKRDAIRQAEAFAVRHGCGTGTPVVR